MAKDGFEEWGGYMDAKITKLEEQFAEASNPFRKSNLFQGISIYVNGLTNPSADELKRIMMVHGGTYHHYERHHTTYIIASNLPDVKIRNMNTSKIIGPEWIVDCLKENRIKDYTKYLLYTNQNRTQPKIKFSKVYEKKEKQTVKENPSDLLTLRKELEILHSRIKEQSNRNEMIKNDKSISPEKVEGDNARLSNKASLNKTKETHNSSKQALTAVNPNFLSEFYNNSRLHHIATLGAGFKQYISELRENHNMVFLAREKVRKSLRPVENFVPYKTLVMHIDMDCFFVSVGLRNQPHLRGKPIAVTHSKGGTSVPSNAGVDRKVEMDLFVKKLGNRANEDKIREGFQNQNSLSEIASCSYEARQKGIKNGMFVGQALNLCPELITIPYDFDGYKTVAFSLYNIITSYTLNIEAVSCDEMFVDLTDLLNELKVNSSDFVSYVRAEVRAKTGCPCSAGVGNNKLQARLATKHAKPDGQYFLTSENVEDYMSKISISDLPGVGYSTKHLLDKLNWKTCGDLQLISLAKLQMEFGNKFGKTLHQFARGIDPRPLVYDQIRKSISTEVNYGIRFKEYSEMETFLRQLCVEVHSRLIEIKRKGKCITLKLMVRAKDAPVETSKFMGHGVCDNLTKSVSLSEYTDNLDIITRTVLATMKTLNVPPNELRGLGIHISKLEETINEKDKKDNIIKNLFEKIALKQKDQCGTGNEVIKTFDETSVSKIDPPIEKKTFATSSKSPNKMQKKIVNKRQKEIKLQKTPNVIAMLRNAESNITRNRTITRSMTLDSEVLAQLPEEIREEVLREYGMVSMFQTKSHQKKIEPKTKVAKTNNINQNEISNGINKDHPQEVIPVIRIEDKKETENFKNTLPEQRSISPPISNNNIFMNDNCNRCLLSWTRSTDKPEQFDIDLTINDAVNLIQAKAIHNLYDPLVYLFRITNKSSNCSWHQAFTQIINSVQNEMILTYGHKLLFNNYLDCQKCNPKK